MKRTKSESLEKEQMVGTDVDEAEGDETLHMLAR